MSWRSKAHSAPISAAVATAPGQGSKSSAISHPDRRNAPPAAGRCAECCSSVDRLPSAAISDANRASCGPAQWAPVVATIRRPSCRASSASASFRSVSSGSPWQVSSTATCSVPNMSTS